MSPSSSSSSGLDDSSLLLDSVLPFMWKLGTVIAGIVAVAAGLLYAKQDSLLYFPEIGGIPRRPRQNPRRYRSPQEHDLPYESHQITCADGVKIHAWLILHPARKNAPTFIFFHGNAGNIGLRLPNAVQMYHALECNILMVEYRGYGDSDDATPNEAGLKLDSEAALRFIKEYPNQNHHSSSLVDPSRIFLFGRSLGGAVAFHLALYAQNTPGMEIAGVIVENTFLSISSMVDQLMPLVAPLKGLILRIGWKSDAIAPLLRKTPILYLAGARDELVPHSHMQELYRLSKHQAGSPVARLHVVDSGTHNETWMQGGKKYWERIARFLAEVHSYQTNGYRASISSMEDVPLEAGTTSSSSSSATAAGVRMGDGGDGIGSISGTSSIPLMPTNILSMAKEASQKVMTATTGGVKESVKKLE